MNDDPNHKTQSRRIGLYCLVLTHDVITAKTFAPVIRYTSFLHFGMRSRKVEVTDGL